MTDGATHPPDAAADDALRGALTLYHRTTREEAQRIARQGFQDPPGRRAAFRRGCRSRWTGFWLSDRAPDAHDRVCETGVVLVQFPAGAAQTLAQWEWCEAGRTDREWLVPTSFLVAEARVALGSDAGEAEAPPTTCVSTDGAADARVIGRSGPRT